MSEVAFETYLHGDRLIGDDYTPDELAAWYRDEAEGYSGLVDGYKRYEYEYHALNTMHGYARLPAGRFGHVVGLGSAFGHEFRPILDRIDRLTILDPSDKFMHRDLDGVPLEYQKPDILGTIHLADSSVDLATSFGCLHHVANVTKVVKEFGRILRPGGHFLIREPVVNMGDWRQPRWGLTKRERGIPVRIMRAAFEQAGLEIIQERPCMFMPMSRILLAIRDRPLYNSRALTTIDAGLSRIFAWNNSYHRDNVFKKIAPACRFWIMRKS